MVKGHLKGCNLYGYSLVSFHFWADSNIVTTHLQSNYLIPDLTSIFTHQQTILIESDWEMPQLEEVPSK